MSGQSGGNQTLKNKPCSASQIHHNVCIGIGDMSDNGFNQGTRNSRIGKISVMHGMPLFSMSSALPAYLFFDMHGAPCLLIKVHDTTGSSGVNSVRWRY
jgi:hypothetical protein